MPPEPRHNRRALRIDTARTAIPYLAGAALVALVVGCDAEPRASSRSGNATSPAPEAAERSSDEQPNAAEHLPTISKAVQASAAIRDSARHNAERPENETDRRWRPGSLQKITLRRTPCDGSCATYELTVHPDGRVVFDGRTSVRAKGRRIHDVDPQRLDGLREAFVDADFLAIDRADLDEACTNSENGKSTTSIAVELDGTTHRLERYEGCDTGTIPMIWNCNPDTEGPWRPPHDIFAKLIRLEETIISTAEAESYIGPRDARQRSVAVPYKGPRRWKFDSPPPSELNSRTSRKGSKGP